MLPYAADVRSSQKEALEIEASPISAKEKSHLGVPRYVVIGVSLSVLLVITIIVVISGGAANNGALGGVVHKNLADLYDQYPKNVQRKAITFWMQMSMPQVGSCFEGEAYLREALLLYRQREHATALEVPKKFSSDDERLHAAHLRLEIGQITDNKKCMEENIEKILHGGFHTTSLNDPHALFVKALLALSEASSDSIESIHSAELGKADVAELRKADAVAADSLESIHEKVQKAFSSEGFFGESFADPDPEKVPKLLQADREELKDLKTQRVAILVFGWGPDAYGGIPETLRDRLDAAKKMAEMFRNAPIIIAGGAANSAEIESVFIRRQLIKEYEADKDEPADAIKARIICATNSRDVLGVASAAVEIVIERRIQNIILVSSAWQLPRISLTMEPALKVRGLPEAKFYPVATGNKPHVANKDASKPAREILKDRLHNIEKVASYRDIARAMNVFAFCDFQKPS